MPAWPAIMGWLDCKGMRGRTTFYALAANQDVARNQAALIASAINQLTNCHWQSNGGCLASELYTRQLGDAALYYDVADKARLIFSTAGAGTMALEIPAPQASIFLTDNETVNLADTYVAALTTAMITYFGCTRSGEVVTGLLAGRRIRRTMARRFGAGVLAPDLTLPA